MMYESVDVVGLNPSPNPFLMMDYYNQSRGCLIPEKGLVPGAPHPYSTSIRNQHWNGSNHCSTEELFGSKSALNGILDGANGLLDPLRDQAQDQIKWTLYP